MNLRARLDRLEAKRPVGSLTSLSDAQLVTRIRDLWQSVVDRGDLDAAAMPALIDTAKLYNLAPKEGEAPADLWGRLRPVLDAEAIRREQPRHWGGGNRAAD